MNPEVNEPQGKFQHSVAIGVFDRRQKLVQRWSILIVKNRVINIADYDSFEQSAGKHGSRYLQLLRLAVEFSRERRR
jgi:hypothetical protein